MPQIQRVLLGVCQSQWIGARKAGNNGDESLVTADELLSPCVTCGGGNVISTAKTQCRLWPLGAAHLPSSSKEEYFLRL